MTNEPKRSRLRLDVPEHLVRAARARAGFDGVEVNTVVTAALEAYLADELATLRKKHPTAGKKGDESSPGKK